MSLATESMNTYEEFQLEKDILFFRVGQHGLVSFHGRNFNIKKRISSDELIRMIEQPVFFKVNTDCYANLRKIEAVSDGQVYFSATDRIVKHVPITKLRQHNLQHILTAQK